MNEDIRWIQRFSNFDRAFILLREAFDQGLANLSQLEKEGTIQRFEVAYELAWKTIKDYLEYQGLAVDPPTPRAAIKEAFGEIGKRYLPAMDELHGFFLEKRLSR